MNRKDFFAALEDAPEETREHWNDASLHCLRQAVRPSHRRRHSEGVIARDLDRQEARR